MDQIQSLTRAEIFQIICQFCSAAYNPTSEDTSEFSEISKCPKCINKSILLLESNIGQSKEIPILDSFNGSSPSQKAKTGQTKASIVLDSGSKSDRSDLSTRTNSSDDNDSNQSKDLTHTKHFEERIQLLEEEINHLKQRNQELETKHQPVQSPKGFTLYFDFIPGIYHDLNIDNTPIASWSKVYCQSYDHITTSEELFDIKNLCNPYSLICVGAYHRDNPNLLLVCAVDFGFFSLQRTFSNTEASISQNGVGWYLVAERAFGFSPDKYITLECSDTCDMMSEEKRIKRISWKLNGGKGHRLGGRFTCSDLYYKVIFMQK